MDRSVAGSVPTGLATDGLKLIANKTYDQLTVSTELLGDSIKYFKPNTLVVALTHEGNIVSLELPKVVELAVTETTPVPKGATATNQMKDATLEGGLRIRVPPFIEVGEVLHETMD